MKKVVYSKRGNQIAVLSIQQFTELFTTPQAFSAITKQEYQQLKAIQLCKK